MNLDPPRRAAIEGRLRRYYKLVDAGRLEEMYELFDNDVVYERGGTSAICGIAAFRSFYQGQRIIEDGIHHLDQVFVEGNWASVRGRFEGRLKDGRDVQIRFSDWHHFRGHLIYERFTYFLGESV